jgi:hypothetical protein
MEHRVQEKVEQYTTIIPSGRFLKGLLDSPSVGLAGVEQLRVPMMNSYDGHDAIRFDFTYEHSGYIHSCIRKRLWSMQKLLYVVLIEQLKTGVISDYTGEKADYIASVQLTMTYPSLEAANATVATWVQRWNDKHPGSAVFLPDGKEMQAIKFPRKGKAKKRVSILINTIFEAGARQASDGWAVDVAPESELGYKTRVHILEDK